jgi:hypothetical protein
MLSSILRCFAVIVSSAGVLVFAQESAQQSPPKTVLLEVVRSSWDAQRNETLVYLRVYSDGLAEGHPMKRVDFRNIRFEKRQLSDNEFAALKKLLTDAATGKLQPEYARYWGNKDYGYRYDITILGSSQRIALVNFQPFLARKEGKSYPQQLEKLGCAVWKLRAEVSDEPLEKDWLAGCAKLGY